MEGPDLIFEYKRDGKDSGFLLYKEPEYIFKTDLYTACIIPLEILKKNLRFLIRAKRAKIVRLNAVEAVVVPRKEFNNLFI